MNLASNVTKMEGVKHKLTFQIGIRIREVKTQNIKLKYKEGFKIKANDC